MPRSGGAQRCQFLCCMCCHTVDMAYVPHSFSFFFFSSRRRHTRCLSDWSSDVCSSDLDTRPVVEEQVKSLGAQFFKIDLGETGQTKDGYAKALTEEQVQKQRDAMKKVCGDSDVVITAAQVFGRRAPILVTAEMLNAMKPGSVVVDLAVETGGNVEGVVYDRVTDRNGVKIVGIANLPARVPLHASQVYSANLTSLIEEFWDKQNKNFVLKLDDEIIKGCLVTHGGKIVNEKLAAKPN